MDQERFRGIAASVSSRESNRFVWISDKTDWHGSRDGGFY
jgi:hypothetical protein